MTTAEIAAKLVQHCREGKNLDAIDDFYADHIKSIEATGQIVTGKQAVIEKNREWYQTVEEIHSTTVGDPIITGNFFACTMDMDITFKQHGRVTMNEICVYQVKDDKIINEQFFYSM